jgi:adenosylhomocysteine nucleosidase
LRGVAQERLVSAAAAPSYQEHDHRRAFMRNLFEREIERGGHTFGTHVGTLLSGSARIFSAKFRDDLAGSVPPGRDRIVGGEMEGVGLLSVSPADKPLWAVVKGISDFADENRDGIIETTRQLACENAVRFVLSALRNNMS